MKKILAIAAVLACVSVAACGAVHLVDYYHDELWGWYDSGFDDGIQYAIENMELWTVDRYDPDAPEESAWNGYDQRIFIDLDGQTYEHGMIQG